MQPLSAVETPHLQLDLYVRTYGANYPKFKFDEIRPKLTKQNLISMTCTYSWKLVTN